MIDEKMFIKELYKFADEEIEKSEEMYKAKNFDMLMQHKYGENCFYKAIQKAKDMPKVGEWIPCSKRLPKETDFPEQKYRILASCSDGIVRNATIEDLRDRSKKHFNGSHCEFAYLAWQPLPEPYKE